MTDTKWLLAEAKRLEEAATDYEEVAFYASLADFIEEQAKRIDQAEGELDGTLWNHEGW